MYLAHYGLEIKPFDISPDPRFLWLGERHREALATLRYGIQENKGYLLLTGDVGTGKTVLINRLIELVDVDVIVATIIDPGLGLMDFYNILADEFKMGREFNQKSEFLIHFKEFLIKAYGDQKNVLMIIDEAQRLGHELLDEVRVLSNIDFNGNKLINIFLVGQSELREMLLEEGNRSFRQRISVNHNIESLNEKETASFIEHRLKVAGATRRYFTADAICEIQTFSNGFPRLINVMCDHALMSGYSSGLTMIDGDIIKECAKELQIPDDAAAGPLKEKFPIDYRPQAKQPKTHKYIEEPEIPAKTSFLNIVGFTVLFILFIGFAIPFLDNSLFEQSPNTAKLVKKTAIQKSLPEEGKEQPTGIADFEGDTKEMPMIMPQFKNLKVVNNTEKIEVDQKHPDKDLEETKTDTIAIDEASSIQLPEKESTEDKQSRIDEETLITPATNQSAKPQQPDKDLEETKTDTIAIDEASSIQLPEKESTEDKQPRIDEEVTLVAQVTNQSTKPQGEQLPFVLLEKKFSIFFRRDSTEIANKDFETLAKIVEFLTRDTNSKVIVEGYTDSYGNNFYNQKLSQLRANMVKSYFVAQGIAISRISAIGLGSEKPIGDNENQGGRSKNRRVEIRFELTTKGDAVN